MTPFVAAVETNAEGHPLRVKLTVVEGFRLTEIAAWAQQHLSWARNVNSPMGWPVVQWRDKRQASVHEADGDRRRESRGRALPSFDG